MWSCSRFESVTTSRVIGPVNANCPALCFAYTHTRSANSESRISPPRDASKHFRSHRLSLIRFPPSLQDRCVSSNRMLSYCSACQLSRKRASLHADSPSRLACCIAHSPRQLGSVQDSIDRLEGLLLHIGGSSCASLTAFALDLVLSVPVSPFFSLDFISSIPGPFSHSLPSRSMSCSSRPFNQISYILDVDNHHIRHQTTRCQQCHPLHLLTFVPCLHFSVLSIPYLCFIHLILHICAIAAGLVEGRATESRFPSLLSRAFALAQPTR